MERRGIIPRPDVRTVRVLKDLSLVAAGVAAGIAIDQSVRDNNVSGLFLLSSFLLLVADKLRHPFAPTITRS